MDDEKSRILRIKNKLRSKSDTQGNRVLDIEGLIRDTEKFEQNSIKNIPNLPLKGERLAHYILYNLGKYMIENNDHLIDFWLA